MFILYFQNMFFQWLFGKKKKELGKVTHYFDKIGVAVVALNDSVKVGDKIKIARSGQEFTATIGSMQINHQDVTSAKAGDEVAIKLSQPTKDGAVVSRA